MDRWIREARYALRALRTRPRFTTLAVVTLALGLGGLVAIAGIVRALLIDPLPYPREHELAHFWSEGSWSAREFDALRREWTGFKAVAAYRNEDVTLQRAGEPTRLVAGIAATAELFDALEVRPMVGRTFMRGDDAMAAAPVAIMSNALWRQLGANPALIGSPLVLDGVSRIVVGVMPPGFSFPDPTIDVWINEPIDPSKQYGLYTLVGRVAAGHQVERMQPALDHVTQILRARFTYSPQWDKTRNASVVALRTQLTGAMRPALLATLAGMAMIFLIACANVAALVVTEVENRSGELAVRVALGADRARLAIQLVLETVIIGVASAAIGAALAAIGFTLLRDSLPLGAWSARASLDWSLLPIAAVAALVASLGIASLPALTLARRDLRLTLESLRGGATKGGRVQSAMIVGETALAALLACGAGLLIHSVANLYAIRPGFDTIGVAVVDLAFPADMRTPARLAMLERVVDDLSRLPGVRSAAATQKLPLRGGGWTMGMRTVDIGADMPSPYFRMVTGHYFSTLGVAVRAGRTFDGSERAADSAISIVVNETLARIFFPGVEPVGRVIPGGFGRRERVVGVVSDIAEGALRDAPHPARYYLSKQVDFVPDEQTLVIKTVRPEDAIQILVAARRAIVSAAPSVALREATTMERVLTRAVGPARQVMNLLAVLAGLALTLSAVGVYGVISQFVGRRRREWGVRVALGLTPPRVVGLVVRRALALVIPGIAVGIAGTLLLARVMSALLYDVSGDDWAVLSAATVLLLTAGVLAALVPAMRAGRTDPALVLREQ